MPLLIGEAATCVILSLVHIATCALILWGAWQGLLLAMKAWVMVAAAVAVWPGLPGLVPQAGGQDLGFASLYRVCRGDSPGRHGRTNVRQNGRLKWRSIA
ncbi:hypothetical protein LP419_38755 [Massilia sp. H-1]|nr:hypothetical protein LP419_38755 [Massilia sp. H-1]